MTCKAIDTCKYHKPNQCIFHHAQHKFCIKHSKFLHLYTSRSLKTHRHASIEFCYCTLRTQNYVNKSRCMKPRYNVILLHALYNHITWLLITTENKNVSCRKVCSGTKQHQKNLHLDSTKYLQHQSTAKEEVCDALHICIKGNILLLSHFVNMIMKKQDRKIHKRTFTLKQTPILKLPIPLEAQKIENTSNSKNNIKALMILIMSKLWSIYLLYRYQRKSSANKENSSNNQDGYTRHQQPTHIGKYQTSLYTQYLLKLFSKFCNQKKYHVINYKMNSICIITTLFEYHKQGHGHTTRALFQSAPSTNNPNFGSNYASQLNQTTTTPDLEIADVNTKKRQTEGETHHPSKKSTPNSTKGIPIQHPSLQDLWLGFQYMEMLAIDLNVEPYVHTLEACM